MRPDVNALDDETRSAIDVLVPPPSTQAVVRRRWLAVLALAAAAVFTWHAGVVRPTIDSQRNGQSSSWNTQTALITIEVMVRSDGLSPIEVRGFRFDERWGSVVSATTADGVALPVTIRRGELTGFVVTVQAPVGGCLPPSALDIDDQPASVLTMRAAARWLPITHEVSLPGVDDLVDMALTNICTGE